MCHKYCENSLLYDLTKKIVFSLPSPLFSFTKCRANPIHPNTESDKVLIKSSGLSFSLRNFRNFFTT